MRQLKDERNIRNESGEIVLFVEKIDLIVQIRTRSKYVTFFIADKLATSGIIGCDYCDPHAESMKPRLAIVETYYGSTVPILGQPSKSNRKRSTGGRTLSLHEEEQFITKNQGDKSCQVETVNPNVS